MPNYLNLLNKILLENKKVIVRGDLDVPMENGIILDTSRIDAMRETLDYLTIRGAKVVLIGHAGRPNGKVEESLRLNPQAQYLSSVNYKIIKLNTILGEEVKENLKVLGNGEILMLENLRFDHREESNDPSFASELASFGDLYVNECFSSSHRSHASFVEITKYVKPYSGLRLAREIESIRKALEDPESPVVAILGGVKIDTKLPVMAKFLSLADYVLLGGRLGLTYEGDNNSKILVPIDYVGDNEDIGPKTINMFENVINIARTVIWNGPMGKFENSSFLEGTKKVAEAVSKSKAYSVVGGGDTLEALNKLGLAGKMSFISMGGGAMLEFIAGNKLPGLIPLGFYE